MSNEPLHDPPTVTLYVLRLRPRRFCMAISQWLTTEFGCVVIFRRLPDDEYYIRYEISGEWQQSPASIHARLAEIIDALVQIWY